MGRIGELLRRIYYDLVITRSRVQIVNAHPVKFTSPPIFVLGLYRSGTTLLRYVLDSHSQIGCPPEVDLLVPLFSLVIEERYRQNLANLGFGQDAIKGQIRNFYDFFLDNWAKAQGKQRWADKSPIYVNYLDELIRFFPDGQFILLFRHGFDQAHSATQGGEFVPDYLKIFRSQENLEENLLLSAVRYWCERTNAMLAFRDANPAQCFSIRYEDLSTNPESHLKPLFDFLHEPWEPTVLEFYKYSHSKGREDSRVRGTRGFSISHNHYKQWQPEILQQAIEIAQPTLTKLGYEV